MLHFKRAHFLFRMPVHSDDPIVNHNRLLLPSLIDHHGLIQQRPGAFQNIRIFLKKRERNILSQQPVSKHLDLLIHFRTALIPVPGIIIQIGQGTHIAQLLPAAKRSAYIFQNVGIHLLPFHQIQTAAFVQECRLQLRLAALRQIAFQQPGTLHHIIPHIEQPN